MMSIINDMKHDMGLVNNEVFPVYDMARNCLCNFFIKFSGDEFFVITVEKTVLYRTPEVFHVLIGLMTSLYVPVNAKILTFGRTRGNYLMQAVQVLTGQNNIQYSKPFFVRLPDGKRKEVLLHRNGKLVCEGEERPDILLGLFLDECSVVREGA